MIDIDESIKKYNKMLDDIDKIDFSLDQIKELSKQNIKIITFDDNDPLAKDLIRFNFDDNEDKKEDKGKKVDPMDIQVGDMIKYGKNKYVIVDYVEHANTNKNKMKEPNIILFDVFNCETEELEYDIAIPEDAEVRLLKNKNDLYQIEYTLPKIEDAERVVKSNTIVMLAKTKSEVEERMAKKFGSKMKIVRFEKLLHARI